MVSIKQGKNLAPALFLFVMQAAMETLDTVGHEHSIAIPSFSWQQEDENDPDNGTLAIQNPNRPGTQFNIWCSIYVDDGAFIFASWDEMIRGTSLLHVHFKHCDMLMPTRASASATCCGSKSKTEATSFPSDDMIRDHKKMHNDL